MIFPLENTEEHENNKNVKIPAANFLLIKSRVDIYTSPLYLFKFKHIVKQHDALHRTLLVDFPHTALQSSSLSMRLSYFSAGVCCFASIITT